MRKFIMSLTTVASLSLAFVPVVGLTQAANAAERDTSAVSIPVADLDLSNPAQAKIFKARVDAASQTVCHAKFRRGELQSTIRACVVASHHEAEDQLSMKQRKALAQAHTTSVEMAAR
jgi:UrcA family protein